MENGGPQIDHAAPKPVATFALFLSWTRSARVLIFFLAAASIWCLLSEFYGLCSMRTFTFWILIPATIAIIAIAACDRVAGDRRLWTNVMLGSFAGFIAAVAYDVFRLPFVIAAANHAGPPWLRLPLYKVFPRFGAMILGQPFAAAQMDSQFTLAAHVVGWAYHLSNGVTFGIMYIAMLGDPRNKSWWWGVLMAVGLELFMLATPYTNFFGIGLTGAFVAATLTAHLIFGAVMGGIVLRFSKSMDVPERHQRHD